MSMFKHARASGWRNTQAIRMLDPRVKQADVRLPLKVGHYYLDDWTVSAYEKWGANDNGDAFERDQLKQAYRTFDGSWACLDHENYHEGLAIGTNLDPVYTPQDYVKVLMAIDEAKAERRHPGLKSAIASGHITDTSMGAWCKLSVCSVCGNRAADPKEFCPDVRHPVRGTIVCSAKTGWKEVVACELNRGVVFFENSIITDSEGADGRAKIIEILASKAQGFARTAGIASIPGDKLYRLLQKEAREATGVHRMYLAHLIGQISRVLDQGDHDG